MIVSAIAFMAAVACVPNKNAAEDTKLSFSQPAMTLERLLPKLGEAAGVKMEADKSIKNEVVLIRVKDMTLKDVMAKVAEVTSGEWVKDGQTLRFRLSSEKARAEKQQDLADTIANVEASRAFYSYFKSTTPTGREAADAISKLIPLSDLALLEPGETVVYALPANRSQRPLPQAAWNLAQEHIKANPDYTKGELAKILVRATCQVRRGFGFQLRFARDDGRCIGGTAAGLPVIPLDPKVKKLEWPHPDAPITLDLRSQSVRSRVQSAIVKLTSNVSYLGSRSREGGMKWAGYFSSDPDEGKRLDPEVKRIIFDPVRNDPLNYGSAEAFSCLADTQEQSIVACIPDWTFIPAQELATKKQTARDFAFMIRYLWDMEIDNAGGCITVWPRYRYEARQDRLSRTALASLLALMDKKQPIGIDAWTDYFSAQPICDSRRTFEHIWVQIVSPADLAEFNPPNRRAFKFLGLLGKGLRKTLVDGASMPLNAMSVVAREYLLKYADAFDIAAPKPFDKDPNTGEWIIDTIDDNLTEVAPNMPMLAGALTLTKSERTILYGDDGKGGVYGLDHKASMIPSSMTVSDHVVMSYPPFILPSYTFGKRTVYFLSIDFAVNPAKLKRFSLTYPFYEDAVLPDSPRMALKETPADFQAWVKQNEEYIERQRAANSGSGRQTTP